MFSPRLRPSRLGFLLLAVACLFSIPAVTASAEPGELTDETILDDTRILEIAITLPAEEWEALRDESRDPARVMRGETLDRFTWRRGDIVVDGVAIGSVGVRKKGLFGSLDSATPSLLVDFNRFVDQEPVRGLGRLTLNNNKQDASLISQSLAYRLFRKAGIAAPRVGFASVTVNGEPLGIYSNVESVRKPFLRRSFGDAGGTLYEGTLCDIVPESLARLEVQGGESAAGRARLEELATMLSGEGPLDLERLGELVDLDNFLRFWAVEALLNVWDGYTANQNNYFFYAAPPDGRLRFIPWGADATVGAMPGFGAPFGGRRTPPAVAAQAVLPNRLYFTPGMPDRYRATLQSLLAEVWREDEILAEVDRLERLLTPALVARQSRAPRALESVREYVRRRREEIEAALADWPAEAPSTWRRPMASEPFGSASGSFVATHRDGAVDDVPPGEVSLDLTIDGRKVAVEGAEASVSTFMFPGFGGFGRGRPPRGDAPPPAGEAVPAAPDEAPSDRGEAPDIRPAGEPPISVVISAKRSDDGKPIALNLFLDRRRVIESSDPLPVNGMVTEGTAGFGVPGFMPMKTISGTFEPTERGTAAGERLAGRFSLEITNIRGGLFNSAPMRRPDPPPAP